jgi:uncharacterized membrane protein YfcA
MELIGLVVLGLLIGFLIGLVGVGGVLLAPALVYLFGYSIHEAVSLALASFVVAGIIAVARASKGGLPLRAADWSLLAAAVPGALVGTLVRPWIAATALSIVISACVALAGISSLSINPPEDAGVEWLPSSIIIGLGLLTGFLSVISGTGGPLVLVPLLLWMGMEVRRTLTLAQAAQLPVAATATLTNGLTGTLDPAAAVVLSLCVVVGMLVGLATGNRVDATQLRRGVAWCLVATGIVLCTADIVRIGQGWWG